MTYPIVMIEWVDALGCAAGWDNDSTLKGLKTTVSTIGYLLEENDDYVLVAGHIIPDVPPQTQGAMSIPKAMITKYYELEVEG